MLLNLGVSILRACVAFQIVLVEIQLMSSPSRVHILLKLTSKLGKSFPLSDLPSIFSGVVLQKCSLFVLESPYGNDTYLKFFDIGDSRSMDSPNLLNIAVCSKEISASRV